MATETQKRFREEMKELQKENPNYFEKNDIYMKRTYSVKRKVVRGIVYTGAGIFILRILLFLITYIIPEFGSTILSW